MNIVDDDVYLSYNYSVFICKRGDIVENKKTKKIMLGSLCLSLLIPLLYSYNVYANRDRTLDEMITDHFVLIDDNGNSKIVNFETVSSQEGEEVSVADKYDVVTHIGGEIDVVDTYDSKEEATEAMNALEETSTQSYALESFDATRSITTGVVYINTSKVTEYSMPQTGVDGYTTGAYGVDAAYIGTVNGKIRAKYAGVIADFNASDVNVVDYTDGADVSYYMEEDGILRHYFYYGSTHALSSTRVGFDLDYLKSDQKYYSYDGHYFYEDYAVMVDDYKRESYSRAVNANSPYYNYYQYLSHRTLSDFTGEDFDNISKNTMGTSSYETSKFKGIGQDFVNNQNTYTVNAMLMFGVAANESNWGRSYIAQDKNNLFGHGAVDSNPYWGANGYESPAKSIEYHAYHFVSRGYLDYGDWRYFGGHLGDKESGMNVKYASDPYWGEKAASRSYFLNEIPEEYGREKVGIIEGVLSSYPFYKEASTSSTVVFRGSKLSNHPVLIVDEVKAEGKTWYKILSDTSLIENRTDHDYSLIYNASHDYLYVLADTVKVVHGGDGEDTKEPDIPVPPTPENPENGHNFKVDGHLIMTEADVTVGDIKKVYPDAVITKSSTTLTDASAFVGTDDKVTVGESSYTVIKLGDVNGDGNVNIIDMALIKRHILKTQLLTGNFDLAGRIKENGGEINIIDMALIKRHLLKTQLISL